MACEKDPNPTQNLTPDQECFLEKSGKSETRLIVESKINEIAAFLATLTDLDVTRIKFEVEFSKLEEALLQDTQTSETSDVETSEILAVSSRSRSKSCKTVTEQRSTCDFFGNCIYYTETKKVSS